MLANLPVELILLICEYPEFKDLGQLAWTNKRMMQIIKKYLPTALERKTLFYLDYENNDVREGRIYLFDSHNISVEQIAKFTNCLLPEEVAAAKDKIFAIDWNSKSFEIFDLNTRQITRGPDPPEWREYASVAYIKGKLYYLGGADPKAHQYTNRVDVLIDGKWQTGPAFPLRISRLQPITCDEVLYVIDRWDRHMTYRLSDNEREWIEIGGCGDDWALESCLCFDPSALVDRRISRIADMNHARYCHSLVVANEKLYSIGGFFHKKFYNSIEEYDPQTNEWHEVGELKFE